MNIKTSACAVGFVLFGWTAFAETYYFKSDATDFSVKESYTVGSATGADSTVVPGPNDIVVMPQITKAYPLTAGTDNFNAFAQIGEFRVNSWAGITFSLTVPSGAVTIDTKFNTLNGSRSRDTARWFAIEKLGAGELLLSGLNKYPATHAQNAHWNYMVTLRVKEGSLAFDTADFGATEIITGILDVSAGATVKVPYHAEKDLTWGCGGLAGAGLITNECTVSGRHTNFGTTQISVYSQDFAFSGAFGGPIQPTFTSENDLRGSRSSFAYNAIVSANDSGWTDAPGMMDGSKLRRITVVDILGQKGEPSPLGTANIQLAPFGGELYYDGSGEETDKMIIFQHTTENGKWPLSLNAGETGGLVWKQSDVTWEQSGNGRDTRVILRGENAKPCVVKCPIKPHSAGNSPNFMKRGAGSWVFANAANTFSGAVFVEEGLLGFTTLKEKGEASSLGTSARLHKWYDGPVTQADWNQLDGRFAFTLGCPTNANAVGALEYLGLERRTMCMTRPFGLNGTGGIVNNGTGELILGNATVMTENGRTALYLGGSNAVESTFYDVTNGVGQITVVKDGSGTWRISNNIDIDAVDVKGGTLVLEKTTGLPYTWFRFIEKEALNIDNNDNPTSAQFPVLEELILQDADGVRQLINPNYEEEVSGTAIYSPRDYHLIGPNSLAYGKSGTISWGGTGQDRGASNLFDNVALPGMFLSRFNGSSTAPTVANPDSWISIVMRMPEGAPTITSCDLVAGNGGAWGTELSAWALEGSRDGLAWEPITNVTGKTESGFTRHRLSGKNGYYYSVIDKGGPDTTAEQAKWVAGDTTPRPGTGYPFAGVVTNQFLFPTRLSSVKVSGGGTLKVLADVPPAVDSLTVDATTGGTVLNVAYAGTGTLNLVNVGNDALITVPGSLQGLNLKGWTVNLPQGMRNRTVEMKDGQIQIRKSGLMMILR